MSFLNGYLFKMVFSSLIFIFAFLPFVLFLYYITPSLYIRNWILVISSILFYAWGEPIWVVLLLISATVDYANGLYIEKFRGRSLAKLALVTTFLVNIGGLVAFKYSDFIVENINTVTGLTLQKPGFALPVGISFYVFMSISYTLDVWYGRVQAQRSFAAFLVYIANFHHLVAGPIIRYGHIAKEVTERYFKWEDFHYGITRFGKGLFKKVCIANTAGALALPMLNGEGDVTILGAWLGVILFSLQIYFDFSGYSDMAIGLGKMFGFHYHENFKHPYTAKSITDFWRRWHISLSSFFKDYVYIPLGGNRYRQVRNILIVWLLTGFWHGASWNFILWGAYFALILLIEKFVLHRILNRLPAIFQHGYALIFIVIGWAIFYFTDLSQLVAHLKLMFGQVEVAFYDYQDVSLLTSNIYWFVLAIILCMPIRAWLCNKMADLSPTFSSFFDLLMNVIFYSCSIALLVGSTYNPFIYFRF